MIVFDLKCGAGGHIFEAWFSNSGAYEEQRRKRLISCPLCNDTKISKAIMAPNVGPKGRDSLPSPSTNMAKPPLGGSTATELRELFGKIASIQAESIKSSKWVGEDFERQARAMDSGDLDQKMIHGKASPEQARSLVEDGIGVMPLLIPVVPPDELN